MLLHVALIGTVNLITVNAHLTEEHFPAILYRQLRTSGEHTYGILCRTAMKNIDKPFGLHRANWRLDSRLIGGGSKWCLLFEIEVAHCTHNLTLNRHR